MWCRVASIYGCPEGDRSFFLQGKAQGAFGGEHLNFAHPVHGEVVDLACMHLTLPVWLSPRDLCRQLRRRAPAGAFPGAHTSM